MEKKACPRCGSPLKKMIYGEPDEMALSDDEIEMGCMCFGDSRDGMYFCIKCEKKFSEDLLPVDLVDCPL